ncbi:MAG: PDZ domain-containing protein [Tannerellaceae bacterium]
MKNTILSVAFLLLVNIWCSQGQTKLYVSPKGNDANIGSIDSPFKTLERARDQIRLLRSKAKEQKYVVLLREGVYRFQEPFVLSQEDSGSDRFPVAYQAYSNEKVVFTGTVPLVTKWKVFNDSIWVTDANLKNQKGFTPRTIWVDGRAMPLARYPNYQDGKRPFGGVASDCIVKDRVAGWESPEGAYVHGMQHGKWGSMHYQLIDVKKDVPHLLLVSTNTTTMYNAAQLHKQDRFVENVFEELDSPGEWFYDQLNKKLYYYPLKTMTDIQSLRFEAPVNTTLIRMEGSAENPVKHILFDGIQFEKTRSTWYLTQEHLPVGDYAIYRNAAVFMEGTEYCKIQNCRFEQLGGNGVLLSNYNRYSAVSRCHFEDLQANGVVLVGSRDAMRDSPWCDVTDEICVKDLTDKWGYILSFPVWKEPYRDSFQSVDVTPGPKGENYPRFCVIEDNLITRIGELEKQAAGILLSMCAENKISHNTIYDLPRAGICVNDGSWGGHIIEYNDVFHTVLSTADHGPFNSWGRDRHWTMKMHGVQKSGHEHAKERARLDSYKTTVIRNNRFGHTVDTHSWGIDLDDGSSNFHIYNNLTIGCSFKLREGFFRTVENNICIGNFPPGKHVCFDSPDDIVRNNIYVNTESNVVFEGIYSKPTQIAEYDHNLYYSLVSKQVVFKLRGSVEEGFLPEMSLKQWKAKGLDVHSVVSDPLFEDIEKMNFKLRKKSPALQVGFKEFALDNFGTTVTEYIKEAQKAHVSYDKPIVAKKEAKKKDDHIRTWMGAKIKNMTTDAEKSAAGIDDIKGVILLEVPRGSALYKAGGRPGDVVLKVNEVTVSTIKDLMKAFARSKGLMKLWVDGNPPAHEITLEISK